MSGIDFFSEEYKKEEPRTDKLFGVSDDGLLAYSTKDMTACGVKVKNPQTRSVQCTPVDHNIVVKKNGNEISQCDAMLYVEANQEVDFIELKDKDRTHSSAIIDQLKSTISLFAANHDLSQFTVKRAYGINKKHPRFQYSKKDDMKQFRKDTTFALYLGGDIHIK